MNGAKTVYITTENPTKNNLIAILLYALAIAAALGFNDLVLTVFSRYKLKGGNELLYKLIYVVLMFVAVLTLAYYSHASVPI